MEEEKCKKNTEELTIKELIIIIVIIFVIGAILYGVITLAENNMDYKTNMNRLENDLVYYETREEVIHDKYEKNDILFSNYDFVFERKNSNGERIAKSINRDTYMKYSKGETYSWEVKKHYDNILVDKTIITVRSFSFLSKNIASKNLYILKTKSEDGVVRFLQVKGEDYKRFKIGEKCIVGNINFDKNLGPLLLDYKEVEIKNEDSFLYNAEANKKIEKKEILKNKKEKNELKIPTDIKPNDVKIF